MADTEYTRMHSLVRDLMGALQDVMPHLENGRSAQERELGAEVRNLIRQAQREVAALPSASLGEPEGWIPVSERLPEQREKPYQVIALCVKRYKEMCYAGEPIRGVYQDWVLRNWPQNYTHWMPFPDLPSAASPASKSAGGGGEGGVGGGSEEFRSIGTVNCHTSGELDLAIGTELFIRTHSPLPDQQKGGA